ncbi:MAG: hypothetical protein OEV17_11715 [Nitrospira sp.]|nr:hypothetical protein [Nitrospira sp.]
MTVRREIASLVGRLMVLSRVEGRDTSDEERNSGSAMAGETFMSRAG